MSAADALDRNTRTDDMGDTLRNTAAGKNTAAGLAAAAASDVDEITGHRRMRRTRVADWSRRLTRETRLTVDDLIW
ncbi:MAG: hypothetical protein VR78_14845, partial [Hoeflea sp. BRH_c9]